MITTMRAFSLAALAVLMDGCGGSSGSSESAPPSKCAGVTCTALDQCHLVGVCDSATGKCSNPLKPNGSTCADGSACTIGDTCQSGVCVPGSPVVCAPADACHLAGVCNGDTGLCSVVLGPDGALCPSGVCLAGACVGLHLAPSYPREVTAFVRPSDTTHLVVQTARGDTVTLEMPKGTLARARHVTLRTLESPLAGPFPTSALIHGIAIEPDGLPLLRGARLRIELVEPRRDLRATAIAWIRSPNDALLVANPTARDRMVEGNLRHFSAYQAVDLGAAAAAGELLLASTPAPQDVHGMVDAAIDARSRAVIARSFCGGRAGCAIGDTNEHSTRAAGLIGGAIDALLADTGPSDPCGSYLADLYEALNAAASLLDSPSLSAAVQDRIGNLMAQCCAPNSCSPACPDCPDQGHWTVQWKKMGNASLDLTREAPSESTVCTDSWDESGGGFAEVQFGTGYVSSFSMSGNSSWQNNVTTTYSGCFSGSSHSRQSVSCALSRSGAAAGESSVSRFGSLQARVAYIEDPIGASGFEASCSGALHVDCQVANTCDGTTLCSNDETHPSLETGSYSAGTSGSVMFPLDPEGLIYSKTEAMDRAVGCWMPGATYSPITYDIEAAWTAPSMQDPPPGSCRGVTCSPGDECHAPGVCDPSTGSCSPPRVRAGMSCGGDYCAAAGTCDAQGACVAGAPIPRCPTPDPRCPGATCDPATGSCSYTSDGTACDDQNACTVADRCMRGTCQGTPMSCTDATKTCRTPPRCGEGTGQCFDLPLARGERCGRGSVCEECDGNGTCVPLSQSTIDKTCFQLIQDTIDACRSRNSDTWRVDAGIETPGGASQSYVACKETGGSWVSTGSATGNLCSHAGAGERQTGYVCSGRVVSSSAAGDMECARSRDSTWGVCEATCTVCEPLP